LLGGIYPGSSLIASDVCAARKAPLHLALWDTSPKVIENLMTVFAGRECAIHARAATVEESDVRTANFLLIDPPNVTRKNWNEIRPFLQAGGAPQIRCVGRGSVLLWLPVSDGTGSLAPDRISEASEINCKTTKVIWARGFGMVGCLLIYRLSDAASKALRDAVDAVVSIAPVAHGVKWTCSHHP
jgi:hypothetical protein